MTSACAVSRGALCGRAQVFSDLALIRLALHGKLPPRQFGCCMDYDLLPYRSLPYAATHPEHLGALAWLFGLEPALPDCARVLELGCASGGNLIPLAARYPRAQFIGIDLSERHVRDANATIGALGLTNVTVTRQDIAKADFAPDSFDYIICHGVYSWIPPEAQTAVFEIAARSLAPDGVLYVSYNIYPGWHLRKIVRDICLYHAGTEGPPDARVARARWALKEIAANTSDSTPYGQSLRNEARLTTSSPDSYILGEFLATHNDPCYFHQFASRAAGQGLAYLGETELRSSLPEAMPGQTGSLIRRIAGDDGLALEQYMDFFGGRQFRRSLLMRADHSASVSRAIRADRLTGLHLASSLREGAPETAGGPIPFADNAAQVMVRDPLSLGIYRFLQAAWPDTRTPDEIRAHLVQKDVLRSDSAPADFLRFLMSAVVGGTVRIARQARRLGRANDPRPEIWPLARQQLISGQPWMANQVHKVIKVSDDNARFLPLVDGTRDHDALAGALADMWLNGQLTSGIPDDTRKDQHLAECKRLVQQTLDLCQRQAMLIAD